MLKFASLIAAAALAGCASTPVPVYPINPAPAPTATPPYARDRCGEDITPTHPATPANVVCS